MIRLFAVAAVLAFAGTADARTTNADLDAMIAAESGEPIALDAGESYVPKETWGKLRKEPKPAKVREPRFPSYQHKSRR